MAARSSAEFGCAANELLARFEGGVDLVVSQIGTDQSGLRRNKLRIGFQRVLVFQDCIREMAGLKGLIGGCEIRIVGGLASCARLQLEG